MRRGMTAQLPLPSQGRGPVVSWSMSVRCLEIGLRKSFLIDSQLLQIIGLKSINAPVRPQSFGTTALSS